jgi:hypothetical protein
MTGKLTDERRLDKLTDGELEYYRDHEDHLAPSQMMATELLAMRVENKNLEIDIHKLATTTGAKFQLLKNEALQAEIDGLRAEVQAMREATAFTGGAWNKAQRDSLRFTIKLTGEPSHYQNPPGSNFETVRTTLALLDTCDILESELDKLRALLTGGKTVWASRDFGLADGSVQIWRAKPVLAQFGCFVGCNNEVPAEFNSDILSGHLPEPGTCIEVRLVVVPVEETNATETK